MRPASATVTDGDVVEYLHHMAMWCIDYRLVPGSDGFMLLAGGDCHAGGPISWPCG